ncbi:MAG: hypothetical protein WBR29_00600 [Gammaproteobacteria bacterium]
MLPYQQDTYDGSEFVGVIAVVNVPKILTCLFMCLISACQAMAGPADTGLLKIHIDVPSPLADRGVILKRMLAPAVYQAHFGDTVPVGQSIDPQNETWVLYVPPQYDDSSAYGVLVWIPPGDDASIPYGWRGALDLHKMIYIAADRSGNDQSVYDRRAPLALTGYSYVRDHYHIDMNRVYIGGFSGGGVVASHIAPAFANIFSGGLFVSTADGINIRPSNGNEDDHAPLPTKAELSEMRSNGRYIFTVGEDDPINSMLVNRAFDSYRALCISRIKLLEVPDTGHENLNHRWLNYALSYLDTPGTPDHPRSCTANGMR